MQLDMKEVGKKIVAKQPYTIIMDDHSTDVPATELTQFVDVLTFSVYRVGKNFENIPFALRVDRSRGRREASSVDLINEHGESIETIESSNLQKFNDPAAFNEEKRAFKFKSNSNSIVVALVLTNMTLKGTNKYLLLLSEPMTVGTMQAKRDSVIFEEMEIAKSKSLSRIEMLWGA